MFNAKNFQNKRFYHGFNIPPRSSFNSTDINFLFKTFPSKYILLLTTIQKHPYHLVTKKSFTLLIFLLIIGALIPLIKCY